MKPEIADYLAGDFNRVTYLGSGSFGGLAQESQLKILELAHGLVATSYDTSMGYRHGPKSFVDDKTGAVTRVWKSFFNLSNT